MQYETGEDTALDGSAWVPDASLDPFGDDDDPQYGAGVAAVTFEPDPDYLEA